MKGAEDLLLRAALPTDLPEISALIATLIPRHIGGTATALGLEHLRAYMAPGVMGARLTGVTYPARNPALVATSGSRIVGYGAVRYGTHVSQVYVVETWHRRGVGSALLDGLIDAIRQCRPAADRVTLNATPRAVEFYLRRGFRPLGPWEPWDTGISLPMELSFT